MDAVSCPGCLQRDQAIAELRAQIAALQAEVAALGRKIDERPSPPRGPANLPPAPAKKPTGRKPGGQPNHPPHLKQLLPVDRVGTFVLSLPQACSGCCAALPTEPGPDDPQPRRRQFAELPKIVAEIVEYKAHTRICPDCGTHNQAAFPPTCRPDSWVPM